MVNSPAQLSPEIIGKYIMLRDGFHKKRDELKAQIQDHQSVVNSHQQR